MRYLVIFPLLLLVLIMTSLPLMGNTRTGVCADGIDNNGDGKIDCEDRSCAVLPVCQVKYSATLDLINNCSGEDLYVTVNAGSDWTSNGVVICEAGQTCKIAPGIYGYDASHDGLDFHIGETPDEATKAEVSYILKKPGYGPPELSYDISVITMCGACPNSCKEPSCCAQHFNEPVRIYENKKCRCLYCADETCPDAFHFPTDNTKQANCPASTKLTIEFCPTKDCEGEHGGVRPCNASERKLCNDCTGDKVYCCPESSYGFSHECLCQEKSQWCAGLPDAGSGCGTDLSKYCYVANLTEEEVTFDFSVNNKIDGSSSICPLYGPSVSIWLPGSNKKIGLHYGMSRRLNADLSVGGGLGIQVNFWFWDREAGIPIQKGPPQNPDNSGDNFIISSSCEIQDIEEPWYGKGQRTSKIADVTARMLGGLCVITVAPNEYTKCVTKGCCSPPGYANTCQEADAYVSECPIP